MAWIVVEGPTCSGKSTLIEALKARLGDERPLDYVHNGKPERLTRRWVLEQYVTAWENHVVSERHVLADRWHYGEATYAPIYRPDTDRDGFGLLGAAGWRWVELFLASRGAVTARLHAYDDVLISRLQERGDDHVQNSDELVQVSKLYRTASSHTASRVVPYDTGQPGGVDDLVTTLLAVAEHEECEVSQLTEWPGYIGRPHPAALLVGDERNITKRYGEETKLPFMPVDGNSGDFLLRALPDDFWKLVGIVNGSEHVGSLRRLWEALGEPPVVALGSKAKVSLTRAGFNEDQVLAVPHPQYVRRFRARDIEAYGEAISTAVETGKVVSEWTQSDR